MSGAWRPEEAEKVRLPTAPPLPEELKSLLPGNEDADSDHAETERLPATAFPAPSLGASAEKTSPPVQAPTPTAPPAAGLSMQPAVDAAQQTVSPTHQHPPVLPDDSELDTETVRLATPAQPAVMPAPRVTRRDLTLPDELKSTELVPALRTHPHVVKRTPVKSLPLRRKRRTVRSASLILSAVLATAIVALGSWAAVEHGPSVVSPGNLLGIRNINVRGTPTKVPLYSGVDLQPRAGSAQGCVGAQAPIPNTTNIIFNADHNPGVAHEVALTFDDGPSAAYTPKILEILKQYNAHATFFVVGNHALKYPGVVEQEWEAGMSIGDHTIAHEYIGPTTQLTKVRDSLGRSADIIKQQTQDPCLWLFRSPYGALKVKSPVSQEIQREGYMIVNWDDDGLDWLRPPAATIAQRIISRVHPGAIILMHDSAPDNENPDRSQTVAALPLVLEALKQRGLTPVALPKFFADAGFVTMPAKTKDLPLHDPTNPLFGQDADPRYTALTGA